MKSRKVMENNVSKTINFKKNLAAKITFDVNSLKDSLIAMQGIFKNLLHYFTDNNKKKPYLFFSNSVFKLITFNENGETNYYKGFIKKKTHSFYIAPPFYFSSVASFTTAAFLVAAVQFFHKEDIFDNFKLNAAGFLLSLFFWLFNLEKQGKSVINYNFIAQNNLVVGILLFIISEIIIFFGMFWSYFHSALSPSSEIGGVWPPYGLEVLEWWKWPTLGTFILVYSGFSVNAFFYFLKSINVKSYFAAGYATITTPSNSFETVRDPNNDFNSMFFQEVSPVVHKKKNFSHHFSSSWAIAFSALSHTLLFGFIFLICQKHEYSHASYGASDGIYGTVFFGITGLHGLHVFLGFVLLLFVFIRLIYGYFFESQPHVSISGAVWYWHFVDIVWIFVYGVVYFWGSRGSVATIITE